MKLRFISINHFLFHFKISTCLVFIMIPGLGYFYGGITHRKNLLTSLLSTALGLAVVSVCWYIWGYSLSFSQSGSVFIGDLSITIDYLSDLIKRSLITFDSRPCIYDRCWSESTSECANNTIEPVLYISRNVRCYNTMSCLWISSWKNDGNFGKTKNPLFYPVILFFVV